VNERCDKGECPAEAVFVTNTFFTGPLFFCAHHEREMGADLVADGFAVTRINATVSP
jgi:hypothetical protein